MVAVARTLLAVLTMFVVAVRFAVLVAEISAWMPVVLAVMVMFAAVVYPQFGSVDRAAFPPLYASFNGRIGVPVVMFEFLAFLVPLALYASRPAEVPAWAVHGCVALGVAYFAITFGWHLPAHRALAVTTQPQR